MNEVEKMMQNAGVEPDYDYFTLFDDKVHKIGRTMHLCKKELKHRLENYQKDYVAIKVIRVDKEYPPFTAEKQLSLIKWLCQNTYRNYIHIRYERDINNWKIECNMIGIREFGNFDECFAGLINNLWQDLTDAERTQIKEILE